MRTGRELIYSLYGDDPRNKLLKHRQGRKTAICKRTEDSRPNSPKSMKNDEEDDGGVVDREDETLDGGGVGLAVGDGALSV